MFDLKNFMHSNNSIQFWIKITQNFEIYVDNNAYVQ